MKVQEGSCLAMIIRGTIHNSVREILVVVLEVLQGASEPLCILFAHKRNDMCFGTQSIVGMSVRWEMHPKQGLSGSKYMQPILGQVIGIARNKVKSQHAYSLVYNSSWF